MRKPSPILRARVNFPPRIFRLAVLAALLLGQVGCATSDADLDYTREKPQDNQKPDQSYHGWTGTPD